MYKQNDVNEKRLSSQKDGMKTIFEVSRRSWNGARNLTEIFTN